MEGRQKKHTFLSGVAAVCAVLFLTAAMIAGIYVEQVLWGLPDRVNFRQCLPWFVLFSVGILYFNSVFDLSRRMHHLAFSVFGSVLLVNIFMMSLPFFEVLYYVQITTLFLMVLFECLAMAGWILLFHRLWYRYNPPLSTVLFCSDGKRGREIAEKINRRTAANRVERVLPYGSEQDILSALAKYPAAVLVSPPAEIKNFVALDCWDSGRELIVVPDIYELVIHNAVLTQFDDLMAYRAKSIGLTPEQRFFKRAADIAGAFLALVLLSPLFLVVSVIVKQDGGPVFFSQNRVTLGDKVFRLYKFRTMVPDAERETGPVLAQRDDPRITRPGRWLRRTRIDEIPQFWNVLKGDMSLVGPRPEREHFIELYSRTLPEYQYRTKVRAGLTGMAHVIGKYNTTPEERILLDLTYIQNFSFFLDLKILAETVRVVCTKGYAEGVDTAPAAPEKEKERV